MTEPAGQQGQGQGQTGTSEADRLTALEGKVEAQDSKLDAILAKLTGGAAPSPAGGGDNGAAPAAGKSVGEQVRDGIAELEAKRKAESDAAAAAARGDDHEARLKALEQAPAEAGTFMQKLQRRLYGQEPDGRPVAR